MKAPLEWTGGGDGADDQPETTTARPDRRYFVVGQFDGGYTACLSTGTAYKRITTIADDIPSAALAKIVCQQDWEAQP